MAADPVVGTWKLDVAKSKFSPGPALKSDELLFAVVIKLSAWPVTSPAARMSFSQRLAT